MFGASLHWYTGRTSSEPACLAESLDDEGSPSSMRVMAAIAFLGSAYLAVVEVFCERGVDIRWFPGDRFLGETGVAHG